MTAVVPTSEAEVFRQFYPHVKFLVTRAGIRKDYIEDLSMNLMIKIMEKDILGQYDPQRKSEFRGADGELKTTSFKTYLSGFVNSYLRHFASRDAIEASRSRVSTDIYVGENGDTPLLDYLGVSIPDGTEEVEVSFLVESVKNRLLNHKNSRMALFFDMILLQVEEHGKIDIQELAEMFEVSRTSVHNWLKKLREEFERCH